jgi:hypothetical protein
MTIYKFSSHLIWQDVNMYQLSYDQPHIKFFLLWIFYFVIHSTAILIISILFVVNTWKSKCHYYHIWLMITASIAGFFLIQTLLSIIIRATISSYIGNRSFFGGLMTYDILTTICNVMGILMLFFETCSNFDLSFTIISIICLQTMILCFHICCVVCEYSTYQSIN